MRLDCNHEYKLLSHQIKKIDDIEYEEWICRKCATVCYMKPYFKTEKERRVELLEWMILTARPRKDKRREE